MAGKTSVRAPLCALWNLASEDLAQISASLRSVSDLAGGDVSVAPRLADLPQTENLRDRFHREWKASAVLCHEGGVNPVPGHDRPDIGREVIVSGGSVTIHVLFDDRSRASALNDP